MTSNMSKSVVSKITEWFRPPIDDCQDRCVGDLQADPAGDSTNETVTETNSDAEIAPPPCMSDTLDPSIAAPKISDLDDRKTQISELESFIEPINTKNVENVSPTEQPEKRIEPGLSGDNTCCAFPETAENNATPVDVKPNLDKNKLSLQAKVILERQTVPKMTSPSKENPSKSKCFSCPCQMVFLKEEDFIKHNSTCNVNKDSLSATPLPDIDYMNGDFFVDNGSYQCRHCRFRCGQIETIAEHQKNHDPRFQCADCLKQLTSYSQLITHRNRQHCAVNHAVTKGRGRPPKTQSKSAGSQPSKLTTGAASIGPPSKPSHSRHGRPPSNSADSPRSKHRSVYPVLVPPSGNGTEKKTPWLQCDKCPVRLKHKMNMMKHEKLHESGLSSPCEICGRPFSLKYHMRKHMNTEHGVPLKKLKWGQTSESRSSSKDTGSSSHLIPLKTCLPRSKMGLFKKQNTTLKTKKGLPISTKKRKFSVNEVGGYQRNTLGNFVCKICKYKTGASHNFLRHLETEKHLRAKGQTVLLERRESGKFFCHYCCYSTDHSSSINSHTKTERHKTAVAESEDKSESVNEKNPAAKNVSMPSATDPKKKKTMEPGSEKSTKRTVSSKLSDPVAKKKSEKSMRQTVVLASTSSIPNEKTIANEPGSERNVATLSPSPSSVSGKEKRTESLGTSTSCSGLLEVPRAATPSSLSLSSLAVETDASTVDGDNEDSNDYKKFVALTTDFKEFKKRPYACTLCFFQTGKLEELGRHCRNHVTGGSDEPAKGDGDLHVGSTSEVHNSDAHNQHAYGQSPFQHVLSPDAQDSGMPQLAYQQPQLQHTPSPVGGYTVSAASTPSRSSDNNTPCGTNQSPFVQSYPQGPYPWGPWSQPVPPMSFMQGHPQGPPPFNPQMSYYPNHLQGQLRTDDLIDLGVDYTKDPSNANPYKCLYCPQRFQTFMVVVGHFDTSHYNIVKAKAEQASMRYQAAQAAQAQNEVKSEPIILE